MNKHKEIGTPLLESRVARVCLETPFSSARDKAHLFSRERTESLVSFASTYGASALRDAESREKRKRAREKRRERERREENAREEKRLISRVREKR